MLMTSLSANAWENSRAGDPALSVSGAEGSARALRDLVRAEPCRRGWRPVVVS